MERSYSCARHFPFFERNLDVKPEIAIADAIDRAIARGDLDEDVLLYLGRYAHDEQGRFRACAIGFAAVGCGIDPGKHHPSFELRDYVRSKTGADYALLSYIENQHLNDVPVKKIASDLRWSVQPWWKRIFRFAFSI